MKKSFTLFTCFLLIAITCFGAGEEVWISTGTGYAKTPSELGPVTPCSSLSFYVDAHIPPGYAIAAKYEWFVNGVSVKTTVDPTDPILLWKIVASPTNVYCLVTYKKTDGTLSTASQSTTFTPDVKSIDFNSITTSTPPPNYGCSSATVSYSLPETPCSGSFCGHTYNVNGAYSITWQPPTGWVQTSYRYAIS